MGVKNLNRYLLNKCSEKSIHKIHLSELTGKTLVIDTSIYLYKYAAEDALIENMYLLISLFKHYSIVPIFIFDGKPPEEKKDLLRKRRLMKKNAEMKYNEIKNKDELSKEDIKELDILKRQFIYITETNINDVKTLMNNYNVRYHDANGEADQLCAYLIHTKKAWGCVSDDMDMFIYGSSRILRGISLLNHTCLLYNTYQILRELKMNLSTFKMIVIISGTDYDSNQNKIQIQKLFEKYYEFIDTKTSNNECDFYNYIKQNTNYIADDNKYNKICELFDITKKIDLTNITNTSTVIQSPFEFEKLKSFLEYYDFIFI